MQREKEKSIGKSSADIPQCEAHNARDVAAVASRGLCIRKPANSFIVSF
jgi:hypothetical protein